MALTIKQCSCGKRFEAIRKDRIYCDECRAARLREQNKEARKRYLQTEKGREKHRASARKTYYRHREERCAKARAYHAVHREELREKMRQRYAETYEILCMRCKLPFDRISTERICAECRAIIEEQRKKKRRDDARAARQQKRAAKTILERKNAIPANVSPLPTEEEKLALLRAVLKKHRVAA